jgi:hypothetical protein
MLGWFMVHTSNSSTGDPEAGGSKDHGQPGLHSEFETSLGYIIRLCLNKRKNNE